MLAVLAIYPTGLFCLGGSTIPQSSILNYTFLLLKFYFWVLYVYIHGTRTPWRGQGVTVEAE